MDKGMTFPYYHIPLFLESANLYLCGMGNVCVLFTRKPFNLFTSIFSGTVGFDVFFIVLCLHCVGLMESLCHMIDCSTSELIPRKRRVEYLRCCIYQYQRVRA